MSQTVQVLTYQQYHNSSEYEIEKKRDKTKKGEYEQLVKKTLLIWLFLVYNMWNMLILDGNDELRQNL